MIRATYIFTLSIHIHGPLVLYVGLNGYTKLAPGDRLFRNHIVMND